MDKIVGVISAKDDISLTQDYINKLKASAWEQCLKIESVPTCQELLQQVDRVWEKPYKNQLMFKTKDEHYRYISQLHTDIISKMSLDDYRKFAYKQLIQKLESAEALLNTAKIQQAVNSQKTKIDEQIQQTTSVLDQRREDVQKHIEETLRNDKRN
jgi:gas vesicle protein